MSYEQKDEPNEKKPGGNNPKKNFWTPLIIALALVLLFGWIYNMVSDSQYTETTYADFYTAMENHQLAEVQRRGSRIYYLTKEEAAKPATEQKACYTGMPSGDWLSMYNELVAQGVISDWQVQEDNSMIMMILYYGITFAILFLFMRTLTKRMGGDGMMGGFGKSKAKVYMEKQTGVTFKDVAGQDEAKESLKEIIDFLHNPQKYAEIGARLPKGALLVGSPGTGKTLLAKAVAGEADVPFFSISGSDDLYGVKITEFHQVKSAANGKITFYEPIMHDIDIKYNDTEGWEIRTYKYLENVGIEDLSFVGNALDGYAHHGEGHAEQAKVGWQYDGAYKPLLLQRVVNSWVRNVHFESVSEALTFAESANSSAYDIRISGKRGHSAVRSQGSSRVFIGKVRDESAGNDVYGKSCQGQFHGCGVSKPSVGTVLWNVTWGNDACFESHATQPRATLIDNCSGGLVYYRAGGDENEVPNHLGDLTLWNLNVTGTDSHASNFAWWSDSDTWWKIFPPIVVGTHGMNVKFPSKEQQQVTYEESTGMKVSPESLYEAQLRERLGYVPGWLNALK